MVISPAKKGGFDPVRLDRITDWMQRYVDEKKIPWKFYFNKQKWK